MFTHALHGVCCQRWNSIVELRKKEVTQVDSLSY